MFFGGCKVEVKTKTTLQNYSHPQAYYIYPVKEKMPKHNYSEVTPVWSYDLSSTGFSLKVRSGQVLRMGRGDSCTRRNDFQYEEGAVCWVKSCPAQNMLLNKQRLLSSLSSLYHSCLISHTVPMQPVPPLCSDPPPVSFSSDPLLSAARPNWVVFSPVSQLTVSVNITVNCFRENSFVTFCF